MIEAGAAPYAAMLYLSPTEAEHERADRFARCAGDGRRLLIHLEIE